MERLHELRLAARELLSQPGSERRVQAEISLPRLDLDLPHIVGEVEIDLIARSTTDAIVVSGVITARWALTCRRCLVPLEGTDHSPFDEVYQDEPRDADINPIVGDIIDLAPAIRDHIALDISDDRVCRADCAGICSVCGADLNETSCNCDTAVRDERWAALDALNLDDDT